MSTIAENLKRLREARGISQRDLADRSGVTSVAMIESGRRTNPGYETVVNLAATLGVEPAQLYGSKTPSRRTPKTGRKSAA